MKGHTMKYLVQETITREYLIHAESIEQALEMAHDIPETADYDESSLGITYVHEIETGKEIII
jgi:hypothetical protein